MVCIQGIQKLTLLDYPGKVACTIFTGGCNLACPFCQNSELIPCAKTGEWSEEEILKFLKKRQGLLEGVCISGGEPLLQPDLPAFIQKIRDLGFKVKLDTNGTFPEKLRKMIDEGLVDYVAMDIKNSLTKYKMTVGSNDCNLDAIQQSAAILLEGKISYEFRTTVVQEFHTEEDFREIGKWIAGAEHYFLQQFVDSERVLQSNLHAHPAKDMEKLCKAVRAYVPSVQLRGM